MGYGDDLLVTALAANLKKKFPNRQIVIGNFAKKQAHHSIIYDNNPNISDCRSLDKNKEIHIVDYHPENRPYINYEKSTSTKYIWNNKYKASPGELYFTTNEIKVAKSIIDDAKLFWKKNNTKKFNGIIFLETSSTKIDHKNWSFKQINKDWGKDNWLALVQELKNSYLIIHSNHNKTLDINEIYKTENMSFRIACATMKLCDIYVGPEGGFSHVAGALDKKAVVYYGGWIDPKIIGYEFHTNIYYEHKFSPCGLYREKCYHCEEARNNISVNYYLNEINKIFK